MTCKDDFKLATMLVKLRNSDEHEALEWYDEL